MRSVDDASSRRKAAELVLSSRASLLSQVVTRLTLFPYSLFTRYETVGSPPCRQRECLVPFAGLTLITLVSRVVLPFA